MTSKQLTPTGFAFWTHAKAFRQAVEIPGTAIQDPASGRQAADYAMDHLLKAFMPPQGQQMKEIKGIDHDPWHVAICDAPGVINLS